MDAKTKKTKKTQHTPGYEVLEALKTTLGNLRDLKANAFRNLDTIDEWIAVVEAAITKAAAS